MNCCNEPCISVSHGPLFYIRSLVFFIMTWWVLGAGGLYAENNQGFRIASYNVENLFDLEYHGTEYEEYIPGGASGWGPDVAQIKYSHIAQVLADLNADLAALQEVESEGALIRLQQELDAKGCSYPYRAFSKAPKQAVGCALFSRFPICNQRDIPVNQGLARSILMLEVDVRGQKLILFVNHWKSKNSPESTRLVCAQALAHEIASLKPGCDYVAIGDFNSDYNEFQTVLTHGTLNDTQGKTGINHVLGTVRSSRLVTATDVTSPGCKHCLFDLWLELSPDKRWSYNFFGQKGSLDHILVPGTLFDGRGIEYQCQSFRRFMPDYLFKGKSINRWQLSDKGRGKHLGKGYSDHLPIFADFSSRIN